MKWEPFADLKTDALDSLFSLCRFVPLNILFIVFMTAEKRKRLHFIANEICKIDFCMYLLLNGKHALEPSPDKQS